MRQPAAPPCARAGCAGRAAGPGCCRAAPISPAKGEATGHGAGFKARRALFLPLGGPNSPHHGTVTGYTALLAPTHPCCCLCFSIPGLSNGVHSHHHWPRSPGCWGRRREDPETALGWARRGSHSFPGDTLGKERQAFGNSRDFVLNPVGLLVLEDVNDFSPCGVAGEGSCPGSTGKAEADTKPSSQHRSFCHQTPRDSGVVWQLTEVLG